MNDDEDEQTTEGLTVTSGKVTVAVPAEKSSDSGKVTLAVTEPFWCTGYNFPKDDGATLTVDREGVEVPEGDADDLIQIAARSGVTLSRSNS